MSHAQSSRSLTSRAADTRRAGHGELVTDALVAENSETRFGAPTVREGLAASTRLIRQRPRPPCLVAARPRQYLHHEIRVKRGRKCESQNGAPTVREGLAASTRLIRQRPRSSCLVAAHPRQYLHHEIRVKRGRKCESQNGAPTVREGLAASTRLIRQRPRPP